MASRPALRLLLRLWPMSSTGSLPSCQRPSFYSYFSPSSPNLRAFVAAEPADRGDFYSVSSSFLEFESVPSRFRSITTGASSEADEAQGPTSIDYRSLLPEEEFHKVADETIHHLQEKLEEYGDCVQIDGYDVDYGNQVLTVKLGDLGTYVINKQTPNRQIWLSSPVSGPSRFDWDSNTRSWLYRRTKAHLLQLLEEEIRNLCAKPISLK